jgi:hypothetical protein
VVECPPRVQTPVLPTTTTKSRKFSSNERMVGLGNDREMERRILILKNVELETTNLIYA